MICAGTRLFALVASGLLAVSSSLAEQPGKWRSLFNGKDLDGWSHVGPGSFGVENGALKTNGGMGLLWYTREQLGNVVIRVVYRNPGGVNSGVFIRIPEKPTEVWMPVYRGYDYDADSVVYFREISVRSLQLAADEFVN
jgi:hypothetical protein